MSGRIRAIILIVFGVAVTFFFWVAIMPERQRMDVFGGSGAIDSGQKFGLHVGMEAKAVRTKLEQTGFEWSLLNDEEPKTCPYVSSNVKRDSILVFEDLRWGGVVCISIFDKKISAISWSYVFVDL